jgi:7-carboxy-7-deazaguanine synthase
MTNSLNINTKAVTELPVMESFYTIQGEGAFTGHASYFIRLAGCDVGCVWCDVKESWNVKDHPLVKVEDLVQQAANVEAPIVVITGGEPLMHNLDTLTTQLRLQHKRTHIETSGSSPLSGSWDWICISPKKFKPALAEVLSAANELKVVIYHKSDLEWAESFLPQISATCKLYLQPEWDKAESVLPLIISYIQENPKWNLSLQVHKWIGIR